MTIFKLNRECEWRTAAVGRFEHLLEAFTSAPARYSETKGSQE